VDPACIEEAMSDALQMAETTRREHGNLAYAFLRDPTDGALLHVFELYETAAAVDEHMASAHMAEFRQKMRAWGVSEIDLHRYEVVNHGPLRPGEESLKER
jgi:quinol monooxygenase YgiN